MSRRLTPIVLLLCCLCNCAFSANWPSWRGPDGLGISTEKEFPTQWSNTENIKWKTPLPGPGNSSPIVWGSRVFVTQALDKGARRTLMCFDRADGKLLWQKEIAHAEADLTHGDNPHCAASPVTDGERVVVWNGSAGLAAYDFDGKELWKRGDLGAITHIWGHASSPVIFEGLVIAYCGPGLRCFLIAVDKETGRDAWKVELPDAQAKTEKEFHGSWTTPLIREFNGRKELIVGLPKVLRAFEPLTGKEIWNCKGLGPLVYNNAIAGPGSEVVVCMSGYGGPAIAVKDGGSGDVTESHRLWLENKQIPQRVGSGVVVGEHVYILNDPGFAQCIEVRTGKEIWREAFASKSSWGSMTLAGGKLYVTDRMGATFVLEPTTTFKAPLKNPLGEVTRASPAFSDGQIFIRTYQNLYCVGK